MGFATVDHIWDEESIDEALAIVQSYREKYKYSSEGIPHEVAQCNVWTELRLKLLSMKKELDYARKASSSPAQ